MDDSHYTQTDLHLPSINGGTSLLVHKVQQIFFFVIPHFVFPLFFLLCIFISLVFYERPYKEACNINSSFLIHLKQI